MAKRKKPRKDRVICSRCGWDGEVRIWGGRFPAYSREVRVDSDSIPQGRGVPRSWRDGVCASCVFREREAQ